MKGIRHLLQCRCILPQFKNVNPPVFHKFVAFSIEDVAGNVIPRYAQCNNCGVIHKITNFCQSDILPGKDSLASVPTLNEIQASLPERLVGLLESYNIDFSLWEHAKFVIENELWGTILTLDSETIDGQRHIKYIKIIGTNLYSVETHVFDELITNEQK